jgi:2-polyprenyl-6-methoxyphenol hydroxylase-like FAD-dependent oxidoreductase
VTGERRAIVVGAGIGGLATAIGLLRTGWQVRVLERAPVLGEVGAGISLWPNAVRALDALGLGTGLRRTGGVQVTGAVRRPDGLRLAVADPATMHAAFGDVLILARADLLDLLRQAVPDACVETGREVTGVDTDGARVRVTHVGGTEIADLVVGADGVRSAVRRLAFPGGPGPRYAGYRAYRLLTPPLPDPPTEGSETWGRGERVGLVPLPDGRVYWFAAVNAPRLAAPQVPPVPLIDELLGRFGGWHEPIPAVLAAARAAGVTPLAHDVEELPDLDRLARGRVALLGDAAHAMTPNLGQGACQALEDAVELAAALAGRPVPDGLARYDARRRPRVQAIVRRSRRVGQVAQWASLPLVAARDAVARISPPGAALRALRPALDWQPPELAPRVGGPH